MKLAQDTILQEGENFAAPSPVFMDQGDEMDQILRTQNDENLDEENLEVVPIMLEQDSEITTTTTTSSNDSSADTAGESSTMMFVLAGVVAVIVIYMVWQASKNKNNK